MARRRSSAPIAASFDQLKPGEREVILDPKLPPMWVDALNVTYREDDICVVRLFADLPECRVECGRFYTTIDFVAQMADVFDKAASRAAGASGQSLHR